MSDNPAISKTTSPWSAIVITLFPNAFPGPLGLSLVGQALANQIWTLKTVSLRQFGIGRRQNVDGKPFGGGPGMVLRADVVASAIDDTLKQEKEMLPVIFLTPRGKQLQQQKIQQLSDGPGVVLISGRFEGIDERITKARNVEEISIGDYILSGGELPSMILIEACVRLLPGVLGNNESLLEESFQNALLEYPHYTQPRVWENLQVPKVLLSGDHKKIDQWRRQNTSHITKVRRPDLLKK